VKTLTELRQSIRKGNNFLLCEEKKKKKSIPSPPPLPIFVFGLETVYIQERSLNRAGGSTLYQYYLFCPGTQFPRVHL
jgi:hypothetical protein